MFSRVFGRLPELNDNLVIGVVALYISLANNQAFWSSLQHVMKTGQSGHGLFIAAVFAVIFTVIFLLLSLFSFRPLLKPMLMLFILVTAFIGYFMDAFGTVIDESMIQNVVETDPAEAGELLSVNLLIHMLLYGVLPSWLLSGIVCRQQSRRKVLLSRILSLLVIVSVTASVVYFSYRDISFIFRENKQITYMINPAYPLRSLVRYYKHHQINTLPFQPVFSDAHRDLSSAKSQRKSLFFIVLGETARADNFHLNGYARNTTPLLEQRQVINYTHTSSCGTATAISVPCIFSMLEHDNYDDTIARNSENLLDALDHAGIKVLWRDNNSGCKGVCDRVPTENMHHLHLADLCGEDGCFDEVLLYRLQEYIDKLDQDAVIVLHQQGSHGPSYFKRYPESFAQFQPECNQTDVYNCSYQEVVNAYDNTILYTDYFLSRVIDLLQSNSKTYDTAMLYVSDHGESLGENGVYLHGLPYILAPQQQTHVPLMLWLSENFSRDQGIDTACLRQQENQPLSHDNILHSMLGVMGVRTHNYLPQKDIFNACHMPQQAADSIKPSLQEPAVAI